MDDLNQNTIDTIQDLRKKLAQLKGRTELFFSLKTKAFPKSLNLTVDDIYIHKGENPFVEIYLRDPNDYIYYGHEDRKKLRKIEMILKKEGS